MVPNALMRTITEVLPRDTPEQDSAPFHTWRGDGSAAIARCSPAGSRSCMHDDHVVRIPRSGMAARSGELAHDLRHARPSDVGRYPITAPALLSLG